MSPTALPELMALLQQFTVETDRYVDTVSARDALHRTDLNALGIMMGAARSGVTVTPGMLRHALNLSSPATTALVDRLDRAGHVRRARSSVDRRQVHLEMTEKALATGSALFSPLARSVERSLENFPQDELELLAAMMRRVTEATVQARQQASGQRPE
ncbi:DNA-binding MarR family transcriptional regulator [Arthrobacter pigmenti]|uniref:DNA-binding MarR family transcriptional regulator n=1 Tax=Arthrobacter pigmenti TaxID=271432 RepID=A0A846RWU1_9MICC|nr:MarR family transcriptional regulator [Arthrobacter pigmenti]NJC23486.1 DNA-binding MarR family transcriptional regulator [Arthrobacter pigmenti]